jgi:signal transduction histidine kinase
LEKKLMFRKTRLKLTAWYLIIIMTISIFFSAVIYFGSALEFNRIIRIQEFRTQYPNLSQRILPGGYLGPDDIRRVPEPDPEVIEQARLRVIESLVSINIIIFILSALAGYFLAGRTLKPIKDMIDEQNRFITDASHELNTPITSLKTSIEVNLRDKQFNLIKAKNALLSNLEEVNNLQVLSGELIEVARYQKPNGNFQTEEFLLENVIQEAVQKLKPLSSKKKIQITTKIPKIKLKGEIRSLTEVFTILLDNAIKYSPEKKSVDIKAKRIDSKVKIIIGDKGIGISKEDLPHIFDRFYRADKSRSKQTIVGYGLGLSIAKRVIVLHNGTIEVESEVNKGTKFIIYLPVV